MSESLQAGNAVINMTVEITRKATGQVETHNLVAEVIDVQTQVPESQTDESVPSQQDK